MPGEATMRIRISVNGRFGFLHCPACGKDVFTRPASILKDWSRCKECGLDIKYNQEPCGSLVVVAVQEDYQNSIYEKWRKR